MQQNHSGTGDNVGGDKKVEGVKIWDNNQSTSVHHTINNYNYYGRSILDQVPSERSKNLLISKIKTRRGIIKKKFREIYTLGDEPIPRKNELAKIFKSVVEERNKITTLWGPQACGKTTLVLLFSLRDDVFDIFRGNVFYIDISKVSSHLQQIKGLYKQTLYYDNSLDTVDEIQEHLSTQWYDNEPRLIILDGLQEHGDQKIFNIVANENCSFLITTREKPSFFMSTIIPIGYWSIEDVFYFIVEQLDKYVDIQKVDLMQVRNLVAYLHEWPPFVTLVVNQIVSKLQENGDSNGRYSANKAIDTILEEIRLFGLNWPDHLYTNCRDRQLTQGIIQSIESLTEEQKKQLEDLVIFPFNVAIPITVIRKLWNFVNSQNDDEQIKSIGSTKARWFIEKLRSLSILSRHDRDRKIIYLDSIVYKYLLSQRKDKHHLLHKKLIETYENFYEIQITSQSIENVIYNISYEDIEEKIYITSYLFHHFERATTDS